MLTNTTSLVKRLATEDEAGNAVEYGLITAVIAVALIAALVVFKNEIGGMFKRAGDSIKAAT